MKTSTRNPLHITPQELEEIFKSKYGSLETTGWSPRRKHRFGFYSPADHYEALINKLADAKTDWIDVGGGKALFPNDPALSGLVAGRVHRLVVVDPSDNIDSNPFPHERAKCLIEDYQTNDQFDLVTFRMVAEHITDPPAVLKILGRLLRPGGAVVIFTVNRWSPITVLSDLVPFRLHHPIKKLFWGGDEEDTFPTVYKMNTRRELRALFESHGFEERYFTYLDDLATFSNFKVLNYLELSAWKTLKRLRLRYPENCLLGVYEKTRTAP